MNKPRISIIAAVGKNRELGKNNELIWRISDDLKRVKSLTGGHPILMGLNTFHAIGKPLPNRTNIILSFEPKEIPGCSVYTSFEKALMFAKTIEQEEIFIFGGASIYRLGLPIAERLYLTLIHETDPDADIFFPEYAHLFKTVVEREDHPEHDPQYSFVTLTR